MGFEKLARDVFDSLSAGVVVIDAAGDIAFVNRAWRKYADDNGHPALTTADEGASYLAPMEIAARNGDTQAAKAFEQITALLAGRSNSCSVEYSRESNGERRWFLLTGTALSSGDGAVMRLLETTERRRAEESAAELAALIRTSPEAIFLLDIRGLVTSCNAAALDLLGYTNEEMTAQTIEDLFPRGHRHEAMTILEWVRAGLPVANMTTELVRKDGHATPAVLSVAPAAASHGKIKSFGIIARDIREQRMLERQVAEANRLASLGRLAATIAHEFNNVLMGISPFAEIVRRNATDDRMRDAAKSIQASTARGKRVTSEILRFARQPAPALAPVATRRWLDRVSHELRAIVSGEVELDVRSAPEVPPILGDESQLTQVLINLVLNARDATPPGGRITIWADDLPSSAQFRGGTVSTPDKYVHVVVKDDGRGIEPDLLPHIFEPLFTTKHNGTGLGLAVVHRIVTSHAGEIFVESRPGEGTEFHLFLPQAVLTEEAMVDGASQVGGGERLAHSSASVQNSEGLEHLGIGRDDDGA
jgi:PAS domain S-box-containing protein